MIALLKEAGLDDPTISWAVDLLYLFITACAAEQSVYVDKESEGQTEAGVVKALEDYYATVSAERYPMVFALRRQLMVGTGDERGSWALKVLINGILGTPAEIV
ncbi:MAG: TetR family transcriptional regulator [Amycolatopsis sp.]|uniref:TetR/AcrR family transcriptional regulator C-terminal domain-containing protein n=1 Tax=Amycolatopsis sp. TaxID=37632 RepID=UPI002615639E|nr:TetR/AcrR family transcriptional regulator C-terminal domain-containing protein [Amycolatopsis sp.]MCU1686043.1 TetR family transcriptional regulator [Amycolatopsis sp.]